MKKSKKPEKTTPGPTGYNHYDGWKYTTKSPMGNYKNKAKRTTFVTESVMNANQTPGLKYQDVSLVSKFQNLTSLDIHLLNSVFANCFYVCHFRLHSRKKVHLGVH